MPNWFPMERSRLSGIAHLPSIRGGKKTQTLISCMCLNSGTCSILKPSSPWKHHPFHLRATEAFPEPKYPEQEEFVGLLISSLLGSLVCVSRTLSAVSSRWAPIPEHDESMHKLLFSPWSRTITKIYLPVNVPCLVNHWAVNLNNGTVPSLSNSIKVQTKVILKNTFQAEEYTITVLYPHKLNNAFISLLGKRTLHDKHRVKKQRQWF